MNSFSPLDRSQNIHQNYLLEASAGTGKTFSIENILVRLLIEKEDISLDQILVVTFTNAAVRDLKMRIHANIIKSIHILKDPLSDNAKKIDYLCQIIEKGEGAIQSALKKLKKALASFDFSQIFTIHKFSARMLSENALEANFNFSLGDVDDLSNNQILKKAIRDFFRGGGISDKFSKAELKILLNKFSGDLDKLENALLNIVQRNIDILEPPSFVATLKKFNDAMHTLKAKHKLTSNNIVEDFIKRAPNYNKINSNGVLKPEILDKVKKFASLFESQDYGSDELDLLIEDKLFLVDIFQDSNKDKRRKEPPPQVHYPNLEKLLESHLQEFINAGHIFSRMAFEFQNVVKKYKEKDEFFSHDDYLKSMNDALKNPVFKANVQAKYKAAIIDEFQDTDPSQWEIFQTLFLRSSSNSLLYLVGDPKQSIYAFRQADIYTYLLAAKEMGSHAHFSLDTNYRSQSSLVHALNLLFCDASCPGMLSLPKLNSSLIYPPVKSSSSISQKQFSDTRGAVHFFVAEDKKSANLENAEKTLFPFMVQEIQRLTEKDHLQYNQFAILVADRYQASRVCDFLREWNIPSSLQKASSLANSPAFPAMKELLTAFINPKDQSSLKIALGGKIIRWNDQEIRALESPEVLEKVLYKFYSLREILFEEGFSSFFFTFQQTAWKEDGLSAYERFLREENSEVFLEDLTQIGDLLLEFENLRKCGPLHLIQCFEQFKKQSENQDDKLKKVSDPSKNAVQIMTIHASKGLEFDVVFALGLIKRSINRALMIPIERDNLRFLASFQDESPEYQMYCEEQDAEKLRQFYVAMTRAKYRVYCPILNTTGKTLNFAEASPMDLYLARLKNAPADYADLYLRIKNFDLESFKEFLDSQKFEASLTYTLLHETPSFLQKYEKKENIELCPPPQILVPGKESFIQSFTTLAACHAVKNLYMDAPRDFMAKEKTPHTLPAGSETGILLHKCLENLRFDHYKGIKRPEELLELVAPFTNGSDYESWQNVLCQMIFNTLKVPLRPSHSGLEFSLSQVSSERCLKESEFFYPSFIEQSPGFIKGFIDLIFEYNGKYFLLDWKSNWLGPLSSHYNTENLKSSMAENSYFLQGELYCEALKKYLKIVDKRPFEEIFGGVFYLYLRGLTLDENNSFGIYYFQVERSGKK